MKLERGIETEQFRLRLIIQTEDVSSHAILSNNQARTDAIIDKIAEFSRGLFNFEPHPKRCLCDECVRWNNGTLSYKDGGHIP